MDIQVGDVWSGEFGRVKIKHIGREHTIADVLDGIKNELPLTKSYIADRYTLIERDGKPVDAKPNIEGFELLEIDWSSNIATIGSIAGVMNVSLDASICLKNFAGFVYEEKPIYIFPHSVGYLYRNGNIYAFANDQELTVVRPKWVAFTKEK